MALSPVFLLLLLPLLPWCASEKGCLWGRGVEAEPPVEAEIPPSPHSLNEQGGAEKQFSCDLSVPKPSLSPCAFFSAVRWVSPNVKHPAKSFLPKATATWTVIILSHIPPTATSPRKSEHFGASQRKQFLCAFCKYSQKRKKSKKKKETHYKNMKMTSYLMALFRLHTALEDEKTPILVSIYLVNRMKCL